MCIWIPGQPKIGEQSEAYVNLVHVPDGEDLNLLDRGAVPILSPIQRARIRTALADVQPIGQKTVRGSLTNDMIHDHDDTMASEDDDLDDPGEDEAELE